jgi:sulfite reductase (ferredoxin)
LNATIERLKASSIDLDELDDFRLHISGCSNSCGRHGVSHLGFFGKAGRKDQNGYPAYSIVVGAKIDGVNGSTLARRIDEISARDVPRFVEEFLKHYSKRKGAFDSFRSYLESEGIDKIHSTCDKCRDIPSLEENEEYYHDWGARQKFTLAGRGKGECASGLFDLIDINLRKVRDARHTLGSTFSPAEKKLLLRSVALNSARALLITKGIESAGDEDVFDLFDEHFIRPGTISDGFRPVAEAAKSSAENIIAMENEVMAFSQAIENLYASMDDSLQFHVSEALEAAKRKESLTVHVELKKDFRGVVCPMNFVKTKMALSGLKTGQVLEILLDDGAPIENVPRSVEAEGHYVVKQQRVAGHWSVLIQKAG